MRDRVCSACGRVCVCVAVCVAVCVWPCVCVRAASVAVHHLRASVRLCDRSHARRVRAQVRYMQLVSALAGSRHLLIMSNRNRFWHLVRGTSSAYD